ncbi:ABC transporter permease [Variovorax paradoxus]|jgi:putative spermidine/putrescine transport system permease protein|uniref:ABC transporter permease n=1 Tax=Variovorax paradoxus TaxID=34073 RepID=UPI0003FAAC56
MISEMVKPGQPVVSNALARPTRLPLFTRYTLVVPVAVFFAVIFLYPVAMMLLKAFTDVPAGAGHLANFAWFFNEETNVRVLWKTLHTSALVTVCCVLVAYPVACAMVATSGTWRLAILGVVLLPFWTSMVVRNFAWVIILQDRGVLNYVLALAGLPPQSILGTSTAVTIGMTQVLLPFVVLPIYSSLRSIDPSMMRAAAVLGAGPITAFFKVYLPLSLPGVTAGALLVFVLALGFYVTPAMLGSPREAMLSELVITQIDRLLAWGRASAMATCLLITTLLVLLAGAYFARRSRNAQQSNK